VSEQGGRRRILTPWDAGAPALTTIPVRSRPVQTGKGPGLMARYRDRPEKRAHVEACHRAWEGLKERAR
jgi:hypothetical protein